MATKYDIQVPTYRPLCLDEFAGDAWTEAEQILDLARDLQALVDAGLIEIQVDGAEEACCELTELGKAVAPATDLVHNDKGEAL